MACYFIYKKIKNLVTKVGTLGTLICWYTMVEIILFYIFPCFKCEFSHYSRSKLLICNAMVRIRIILFHTSLYLKCEFSHYFIKIKLYYFFFLSQDTYNIGVLCQFLSDPLYFFHVEYRQRVSLFLNIKSFFMGT
jgi:hypothetical protein